MSLPVTASNYCRTWRPSQAQIEMLEQEKMKNDETNLKSSKLKLEKWVEKMQKSVKSIEKELEVRLAALQNDNRID